MPSTMPLCRKLVACLILCAATASALAEDTRVDFQQMVSDLQKLHMQDNGFRLVWWIPTQYWQAVLSNRSDLSPEQVKEFLDSVQPYTIVAIVEAEVGAWGTSTFTPEEDIKANTVLIDGKGTRHKPLPDRKINGPVKMTLSVMKPVLAQMIGPMGESMYFLVFPGVDKKGKQIADATGKGSLVVQLKDEEFRWKLPIGAFLTKRPCPQCKEVCNGAWIYCPWCGAQLPESKPLQFSAGKKASSQPAPRE